jgi:sulfatase modifying factor 1
MPNNLNKDISGFNRDDESKVTTSNGVNYLFIIAIDDYKHCPRLHNAVKDAKEVSTILTKKFQFQEQHVRCLYDTEATKRNIYQAFRDYAQKVTAKDNLVIYFSGHGEYDEFLKDGYWIPFEAEKDGIDQYLANSEIRSFLSAIKTHHTFIMIDSCFSGSLFAKGASRNAALAKERDPSRWGLTSGRNEIVTDGHPGENSPFAESIIYYLDKADRPVGVAELCDKVLEVVTSSANQTPRGEPLKVDGHKGGQFVFHLKKNEDQDWQDATKADTIASYETFLKMHPTGKFSEEANRRAFEMKEERDWKNATTKNTLEAFYNFIRHYPNSKHEHQARIFIHSIEEDKFWQIAQNAETVSKYYDYLRLYRDGRYAEEAHKRIADILSNDKTNPPQAPSGDHNNIKPFIDRWVSSLV